MFGNDQSSHDNPAPSDDAPAADASPTEPTQASEPADDVSMDSPSFLPGVQGASSDASPASDDDHDNAGLDDLAKSDDEPAATPSAPAVVSPSTDKEEPSSELLALKQQALQALSPLVDHLDQSPEERFKTLMMMIQAADDQTMISDAYKAAQEITDDKVKAQALLDVVNEINYFTQQADN